MNITDVRIRKINDESKMKAVVSITFDDEFVVHDIKIIEGKWVKEISGTSRIHLFPRLETRSGMLFLKSTKKSWLRKLPKRKLPLMKSRITISRQTYCL